MTDPHDISGEPHYMLRLGKKAARVDPRTIKFESIVKPVLPPVPDSYDFDKAFPDISFPSGVTYGNLKHGCCVEVTKYLWQMRAEVVEQGVLLPITEEDVLNQYFDETGGQENDYGLVMLDSFHQWRHEGIRIGGHKVGSWTIGGDKYKIRAFAKIDVKDIESLKIAIYLLYGLPTGIMLPKTAGDQWNDGKPWEVVDKPGNEIGSWGGHAVNSYAYTCINPKTDNYYFECYTWGRRQAMSYDFIRSYCDENYGIVDRKNKCTSVIDEWKLNSILNMIDD